MTGLLQLFTVFVIVPFLTYHALGFYVGVRMALGGGFSIWNGLLTFHAIELPDGVGGDDVLDHIEDWIEDAA